MTALAFDARQAVGALRRMASFFVLAALTLAIGFAAHFAALTIVDRLLLASPPHVHDPGALGLHKGLPSDLCDPS